jgi:hypothetical protein
MNDLIVSADMAQSFPTLFEGLRKVQDILGSIQSFADIERVFLQGAGLSPNTYRSYLQAVRQFYAFTKGKHPLSRSPRATSRPSTTTWRNVWTETRHTCGSAG